METLRRIRRLFVLLAVVVVAPLLPTGRAEAQELPPPGPGSDASAGYYHPLTPARVLDTRSGLGGSGKVGAGQELTLQVAGRGGVPADAAAVVLNVTVTEPTAGGHVTVYPTGTSKPTASNLNFTPGQTVPNLVVAKLGSDGRVQLLNSAGSTHFVADVMGWFDDVFASFPDLPEGGARQHAITPTRLLDTRDRAAKVGPGQEIELTVAGQNGIPANATAAVLNVTVTDPTSGGHLSVFPSGSSRPTASNLNFTPGQTVPNLVIAKVGAGGKVRIYNSSGTSHVIVDAVAYFEPTEQLLGGGEFNALSPARLLDTRIGQGAPAGKVGSGQEVALQVTGAGGVLDFNVDSVVLNVTVTEPTSHSFLTAYPSGTARPTASNLNFGAGQTVPNLVVAKVGSDGKVNLFNNLGGVHVIADVVGWFNGSMEGPGQPPFAAADSGEATAGGAAAAPSDLHVGGADPGFAEDQQTFWAEHDPEEMLAKSSPEALIERDGTTAGRETMAGNDFSKFPIWSQGYSYPTYYKPIGRLLFWKPAENRWSNCTATMVAKNLAVTAAHCIGNNAGRYTNLAFFGGLQGNSANSGIYTNVVDTIAPAITSTGQLAYLHGNYGYAADYAFVKFGPTNNVYPGQVTGWYSMQANASFDWLLSFGYPSEGNYFSRYCTSPTSQMNAGCYLYQTWGRYGEYKQYSQGWYEVGWGSDMSGGASGGPVFANVNGQMRIVSVNSNGKTEVCDAPTATGCNWRRHVLNMWGPYFNQTIINAYNQHVVR